MSDWNLVVKRLEVIYNETAPEAIKGTAAAKNLDDFTRLKQEIHAKLASARKIVKDVHAMQETGSTNPETKKAIAVQRHTVTKLLKEVGPMQEQLKEIQEKDARKAAKQAEKDPEVANLHKAREEIVKLVLEHMREVEDMSKRRPGDLASSDMSPSRRRLLEGGSSSTSSGPIIHANGDTELADFNCENELDLLRDGESKLDKNLDLIASGVANLKGKAEQMNSTLVEQGDLIDDITKKAGQVNERLLTMNEKLKKNVEKAMSGDKFVVNCVLITIILIAIGFTASQLT